MSERVFPRTNASAQSESSRGRKLVRTLKASTLSAFLLGSACAHYEPPPPQAPVRHALQERPAPEQEEEPKIHRAPPPNYGNKVVLCPIVSVPEG